MNSPGRQGASRTMGGIFRGNAYGNSLNAADLISHGQFENIGPVQGKLMLYLSSTDPAALSPDKMTPSISVKVDVSDQTIGSVLGKVSSRYSPIQSRSYVIYFF